MDGLVSLETDPGRRRPELRCRRPVLAAARGRAGVFSHVYGGDVLAVAAGIVSHVPARLGVFETVLLLALPDVPWDSLLAAILAYRAIYYLAPLAMAAMLAAGMLVHARRSALTQGLGRARQAFGWMAPMTVSSAVFIAGALLLFSGSTPAAYSRPGL